MFNASKSAGFSMQAARRDRAVRLEQLAKVQKEAREFFDELCTVGVVIVNDRHVATALKGLLHNRRGFRWNNEPSRTVFAVVR